MFLLCSAFHEAPLILNAWGGGGGGGGGGDIHLFVPSSSCGFVLVSISCVSLLLLIVCFLGVVHITACGKVISHTIINRW